MINNYYRSRHHTLKLLKKSLHNFWPNKFDVDLEKPVSSLNLHFNPKTLIIDNALEISIMLNMDGS